MPQWSPWALAEPAASPAVSEEQRSLLAILDLRREMPALRATKSFLSLLFQVPRVLLLLVRDALLALSWSLLHLLPPLENEPKAMLSPSEHQERLRSHGQQLQQLQAELNKLRKEVARVRKAHSERVAKLVFQRLNEDFVQKPDYALSSVGATIDLEKTSHDYEDTNMAYFWNRFSFWNYARPPTVILEGLQVDDKTEVFLGRFTFDVKKFAIQTFHLQNDSPSAFPKVKIQILSNWGHPRFTCLYRVRAHGLRISEGEGSATGATRGPH